MICRAAEVLSAIKASWDYFNRYFIGYRTQTKFVSLSFEENNAHLEVECTGEFQKEKSAAFLIVRLKMGK